MSQKNKKNICNPAVFKQVFDLYAKDLRNFLIYKFQDVTTAEDVLQECFIKLWENCDKIFYEKVKSFLFTVGNNTFLNIKKHEQIVRKHQSASVEKNTDYISPEHILIEQEYAQKLQNLIERLPEKQKQVFIMSRIEKLKYKEIADRLNISVKTVEKRMSDALKFLRTHLEFFK